MVFSGNFEYHPNIDAVDFLVNSIWPEVRRKCPDLRLRLVGRGDAFIRHLLPSGFNIEVTGAVDDALAQIAAARIVVAPLHAGSGTRIKILEAWAAARPVIATLLAAEGLEYVKDRDLLIANDGPSIVGAIAGLNADPDQRAHRFWRSLSVWATLYLAGCVARPGCRAHYYYPAFSRYWYWPSLY